MTNMISVRNLTKAFEEKMLFENVNLTIEHGERIGIVGANGAGKTSLANILTGYSKQDDGAVDVRGSVGYLQQSTEMKASNASSINGEFLKRTKELGMVREYSGSETHLSGGEKLKLSLAKIWAANPDILLLDEPTNHLDLKGVEWLINELSSFEGAVLIISHDRYFLDRSVNRVIEIEDRQVHEYVGNYSDYRAEKKRRYDEKLHHYHVQESERKRIEKHLASLENWSEKAHNDSTKQEGKKEYYRMKAKKMDKQVKSTRKQLQKKLDDSGIERPKDEQKVRFQFQESTGHGKRIIEASDIAVRFNDRTLFDKTSFYIKKGERVGIVGDNGCGKTTLLRLFVEEKECSEGEVWRSPSLSIGYLSQDVHDLPEDKDAIEALGYITRDDIYQAKTILATMGLERTRQTIPIRMLSLGERTKIKLTGILMNKHDVLVLDEPTNHLDLPSREQLEETLMEFGGTVIVVSHDRYFMDKMCDRLLVHEENRFHRVEMGLSEYETKKKSTTDPTSEEQKMLLENSISAIISEISLLPPGDPKIKELDVELSNLTKKKRES
ncbi:ribosomal protection-like ABC-F family protein [Alkalihalobacillus sp. CinArs1]|uniref:ribosomal protection-like ABC-F family protein n=1 Tax=Alkalihalobacillus sp. CinArs1 TaxID=2995314 RepID=UPI0022DDDA32|nr:ABC-F type ribosomal protection protein [Alkalihalobacillus sp. CinArs1]